MKRRREYDEEHACACGLLRSPFILARIQTYCTAEDGPDDPRVRTASNDKQKRAWRSNCLYFSHVLNCSPANAVSASQWLSVHTKSPSSPKHAAMTQEYLPLMLSLLLTPLVEQQAPPTPMYRRRTRHRRTANA